MSLYYAYTHSVSQNINSEVLGAPADFIEFIINSIIVITGLVCIYRYTYSITLL